jgi:hypothetical protein
MLGQSISAISAGGSTVTDAVIAMAMVAVWFVIGAVCFVTNTQQQGHKVLAWEKSGMI